MTFTKPFKETIKDNIAKTVPQILPNVQII